MSVPSSHRNHSERNAETSGQNKAKKFNKIAYASAGQPLFPTTILYSPPNSNRRQENIGQSSNSQFPQPKHVEHHAEYIE